MAAPPSARARGSSRPRAASRQVRGFTLLDVLLVIVLLGIVAAALTTISSRLSAQTSETLKTRQALAFAQGLLDEVRHMPFPYCDPNDARARLATGASLGGTGCATIVDALGPEPGETRYNPANRFDSVSDYQGFTMPGPGCPGGLCDLNGVVLNTTGPLIGCSVLVTLATQALAGIAALDTNGRPQALRIVVALSCPGWPPVYAEGLRVRHAPNQL